MGPVKLTMKLIFANVIGRSILAKMKLVLSGINCHFVGGWLMDFKDYGRKTMGKVKWLVHFKMLSKDLVFLCQWKIYSE